MGRSYLVNAQGKLFKQLSASDSINLPVVTGLKLLEKLKNHKKIGHILSRAIVVKKEVEKKIMALRPSSMNCIGIKI